MADDTVLTTALSDLTAQLTQLNNYYAEQQIQTSSFMDSMSTNLPGSSTLGNIPASYMMQTPGAQVGAALAGQQSVSFVSSNDPPLSNIAAENNINTKVLSEYGGPIGQVAAQYQLGVAAATNNMNLLGGGLGSFANRFSPVGGTVGPDGSVTPGAWSSYPGANALSSASSQMSQWLTGVNPITGDPILDANGNPKGASISPQRLYLAQQAISNIGNLTGDINSGFSNQQQVGYSLGYGPGDFGAAIAGHEIPFLNTIGTAQRVGASANALTNFLTGTNFTNPLGSNITSGLAQSDVSTLIGQGFGLNPQSSVLSHFQMPTGDAATIAAGLNNPLQNAMPGLTAGSIGEFTPMLRNSATSTQQLAEALSTLGTEARTTKEGVNELAQNLAQASSTLQGLGSSGVASLDTANAFTASTGLDPGVYAQLAQNPLVQGLALSQGILPSGMGDIGGMGTKLTQHAVNMLGSMLSGIDRNRWTTVDGHRVEVANGSVLEDSQIASMLGVPEAYVKRMRGDSANTLRNASAQELLGGPNSDDKGTLYNYLNTGQYGKLKAALDSERSAYGLTDSQWDKLMAGGNSSSAWNARLKGLSNDLAGKPMRDKNNQILGGSNKETVKIELTGYAKKLLRVASISTNKISANAGQAAINSYVNSVPGDLTNTQLLQGIPKADDHAVEMANAAKLGPFAGDWGKH